MMLRITVLLFAALTAVSAQSARPRPPVAWWENPVANGLTLTDAQKKRINHVIGEHRENLAAKRQEAEKADRELEAVLNADTVDFQRGKVVTEQLVKARGELTQEMVRMTLRLRAVLTPEQWRTLQDRNVGRDAKARGRKGPKPTNTPFPQETH